MKWLLGACATLAAVTLLIARVDVPDADVRRNDARSDLQREQTIAREVRAAQARLSEAVYLDSLLPLLPPQAGVRVLLAPFVAPAVAARIHASVSQQLAALDSPRARTGVFVMPLSLGAHPALGNGSPRYTYFAGTDERGAFCFVIASTHAPADSLLERVVGLAGGRRDLAEPLGPCFYWARYGAPGPRMQQWLRVSGYRFTELRQADGSARDERPVRRRIFGVRDWSGRSLWADACLAGDRQACASALMQHDDNMIHRYLSPDALAVYERMGYRSVAFGSAERALLADLERAFGPERFAHFWRSNDAVEAAFATAFGEPLREWVHRWAVEHYPAAPPLRAAPDPWTVLLSLLAVVALCATAAVTARRRQITC